MGRVMMSVSPVYYHMIINGEKRYEYRKKRCKNQITSIVLYITRPVSKIMGEIKVGAPIVGNPEKVWHMTEKGAGISRENLFTYCGKSGTIYAYPIKEVEIYEEPRQLQDYGKKYPPQLFYYL